MPFRLLRAGELTSSTSPCTGTAGSRPATVLTGVGCAMFASLASNQVMRSNRSEKGPSTCQRTPRFRVSLSDSRKVSSKCRAVYLTDAAVRAGVVAEPPLEYPSKKDAIPAPPFLLTGSLDVKPLSKLKAPVAAFDWI